MNGPLHLLPVNPLVRRFANLYASSHTDATKKHKRTVNSGDINAPVSASNWSLTSLQLKLIKIGARAVRHTRAITFQLAEVAVTGPIVRAILTAIRRLRAPPLCACQRSTRKLNESSRIALSTALKNGDAGPK